MTELRNIEVELDRFRARTIAAAAFVLLCFGVLIFRWFVLQVVRHDDLQAQAEANRILASSLTPQIIQYKYVDTWDGKLPVYSGAGVQPMITLPH